MWLGCTPSDQAPTRISVLAVHAHSSERARAADRSRAPHTVCAVSSYLCPRGLRVPRALRLRACCFHRLDRFMR